MNDALRDKRVLITQAADFMGPALCEVLAEQGAEIVAHYAPLADPEAARALLVQSGPIDVLVANLALPAPSTPALAVDDAE